MQHESSPSVPAVVAVVVTCDPGPWFEETLASLAAQDYPNLSVLVVDAGSSADPTPIVASVIPSAYVRRLGRRVPFGTGANEVLSVVEGASHLLFCHDDVALAPEAVSQLVEEAFRSNGGIVCPKYVLWDQPQHLLAVGATTDKVGVLRHLVDQGELDQEQHDAVREVLVAPSGALLVRADLFAALGGFDPSIPNYGEDINLSWRARLAGARVLVVPSARVRHLEATRHGVRAMPRGEAARWAGIPESTRYDTHRYRTLLSCYRWFTLAWIMPLAIFWALGEAVTFVLLGRWKAAAAALTALGRSLHRPSQLAASRRQVQRSRAVGDGALRVLQVHGNTRLRSFLQTRFEGVRSGFHAQLRSNRFAQEMYGPEPDADGREVQSLEVDRQRARGGVTSRKLVAALMVLVLALLILGSRSLIGIGLPRIGSLPDTSAGVGSIWRTWWSTWQPDGLGVSAPSSPATGLLGLLSLICFGAVGTAAHIAVLGCLVLGPLGAYRACRHWGSRGGQVAAMIAYVVVPLPYNALAAGRWDGLVAYAVTPWVLSGLIHLSGAVPLTPLIFKRMWGRLLGLALLIAVCASVAPSYLYVIPLVGLFLLVGSLLSGHLRSALRLFALAVVAAAAALVVLVPWSFSVMGSRAAVLGPNLGAAGRMGLGQVMRFNTGPFGGSGFEWLLLIAAALPLLVGRGWRLEWAARMWIVALGCFFLTWAGYRGWVPALPANVILAPAATALAASAALGVSAFEIDLPGYRFGWRQGTAAAAALCLALAAAPFVAATSSGRWKLPSSDPSKVLAFLPDAHAGDYRVLWIGAPSALPVASRQLDKGIGFGTSYDGVSSLANAWIPGSAGASSEIASDLRLAQGRLTTKLGHLLAPTAVRYVIIPNHAGPAGSGARAVPVPSMLLAGLGVQTDLQTLDVGDANYTVYQNSAWMPAKAQLPADISALAAEPASQSKRTIQQTSFSDVTPALAAGRIEARSGPIDTSKDLYVAMSASSAWHVSVDGKSAKQTPAFGWAMSFAAPAGAAAVGKAKLTHTTPPGERAGIVIGAVLWVLVVLAVLFDRARRRRPGAPSEAADPAWFTPATLPTGSVSTVPRRRPNDRRPAPRRPAAARSAASRAPRPGDWDLREDDKDDLWSEVTDV